MTFSRDEEAVFDAIIGCRIELRAALTQISTVASDVLGEAVFGYAQVSEAQ